MIPKIIHLCWLSGDPYPKLVKKCIKSWKKILPNYEIILCDPRDFVHFRKRIGETGSQKIFEYGVKMFGRKAEESLVVSDTTVQGNNTTFPTDARLYKKAVSAMRKLHTIAGRQVRESERVMTEEQLKVCSIHKPQTACIAKGKASHMYEFGQKVGMILTAQSQIIVAIKAFEGNPHDSKTVEPLLEQMASEKQKLPETLAYDRGGRGAKEVMGVKVITPGKPKKSDTAGGPQYKLQAA